MFNKNKKRIELLTKATSDTFGKVDEKLNVIDKKLNAIADFLGGEFKSVWTKERNLFDKEAHFEEYITLCKKNQLGEVKNVKRK